MKKPTTLAQQVRDAQKIVNSWSPQKREATRLSGVDAYLNRGNDQVILPPSGQQGKKKS